MKKRDRICPYHKIEGDLKYQFCEAAGKVCYCDANEWYCDHRIQWDKTEEALDE